MDLSSLNTCFTIDEMKEMVSRLTPAAIQNQIATLTLEQIPLFCNALKHEPNTDITKQKLLAGLLGLTKREQIEALGKALSFDQLVYLLTCHETIEQNDPAKLYSLFIGIPYSQFENLLINISPEIQALLKKEGVTEPIQHHLNTFAHEYFEKIKHFELKLNEIQEEIRALDLTTAERTEVLEIQQKIAVLIEQLANALPFLDNALAIIWNANRSDLIEKFTNLKELFVKHLNYATGTPTGIHPEIGLLDLLKNRIHEVYNEPPEILKDEDLAIEALAKFSIWYAEDYADVGLLPDNHLPLPTATQSEQEWTKAQTELNHEVQAQLQKLGLSSIKNLKEKIIFSKKSLKAYVKSNPMPSK